MWPWTSNFHTSLSPSQPWWSSRVAEFGRTYDWALILSHKTARRNCQNHTVKYSWLPGATSLPWRGRAITLERKSRKMVLVNYDGRMWSVCLGPSGRPFYGAPIRDSPWDLVRPPFCRLVHPWVMWPWDCQPPPPPTTSPPPTPTPHFAARALNYALAHARTHEHARTHTHARARAHARTHIGNYTHSHGRIFRHTQCQSPLV